MRKNAKIHSTKQHCRTTSSLDRHSERLIHKSLERLHQNRTVVVIAHRLSTTAGADQILVLDNGKLVERGSHEVLLQQESLYEQLWRLLSVITRNADSETITSN